MQRGFRGFWFVVTHADHMLRAAAIADKSTGITTTHPNSGCVIAQGPKIIAEGSLRIGGGQSTDLQALKKAQGLAKGATTYLNLEPFTKDALMALCEAGLSRVIVGLKNPLNGLNGKAIETLKSAGIPVNVLGKRPFIDNVYVDEATKACQNVNTSLLFTAADGLPYSTLLTAEASGKGRKVLAELRSRSNAIVLDVKSARRVLYDVMVSHMQVGHSPMRIVVSPSLHVLPEESWLWDVSMSRMLVATCRGSGREFQKRLRCRGVEVVEFEELTPRALMEHCWSKLGFTSVLWECGGEFVAAAIVGGVIHKVATGDGESKLISMLVAAGDPFGVEANSSSSSS